MKNKLLLPSLLVVALLQACGGGGNDNDNAATAAPATTPANTTPTAATGTDTGSVPAAFVAGSTPRYQLSSANSQSFGKADPFVQQVSGSVTTLGGTALDGGSASKDISGDATYAMGRWVLGTVTRSSGSETLTGDDSRSYHYIVLNAPSAFPASGALTCDSGVFTTPTSASVSTTGTASGSASLAFGTGGATIAGSVSVSAAGSTGVASLSATASTVSSTPITGSYLSNGSGAAVQVGESGAGVYLVAASYAATLTNGARYIGVARFRCK